MLCYPEYALQEFGLNSSYVQDPGDLSWEPRGTVSALLELQVG